MELKRFKINEQEGQEPEKGQEAEFVTFTEFDRTIGNIERDMTDLEDKVDELERETQWLTSSDVSSIEQDVSDLNSEVSDLWNELNRLKDDFEEYKLSNGSNESLDHKVNEIYEITWNDKQQKEIDNIWNAIIELEKRIGLPESVKHNEANLDKTGRKYDDENREDLVVQDDEEEKKKEAPQKPKSVMKWDDYQAYFYHQD